MYKQVGYLRMHCIHMTCTCTNKSGACTVVEFGHCEVMLRLPHTHIAHTYMYTCMYVCIQMHIHIHMYMWIYEGRVEGRVEGQGRGHLHPAVRIALLDESNRAVDVQPDAVLLLQGYIDTHIYIHTTSYSSCREGDERVTCGFFSFAELLQGYTHIYIHTYDAHLEGTELLQGAHVQLLQLRRAGEARHEAGCVPVVARPNHSTAHLC